MKEHVVQARLVDDGGFLLAANRIDDRNLIPLILVKAIKHLVGATKPQYLTRI